MHIRLFLHTYMHIPALTSVQVQELGVRAFVDIAPYAVQKSIDMDSYRTDGLLDALISLLGLGMSALTHERLCQHVCVGNHSMLFVLSMYVYLCIYGSVSIQV